MPFGAHRHLELVPAQRRTEDWAAWLKKPASSEALQPNGVVANALDEFCHSIHGTGVVARNTERASLRRTDGPALVFEVVVTDVVERLDDR